jgi:hypothetical protein
MTWPLHKMVSLLCKERLKHYEMRSDSSVRHSVKEITSFVCAAFNCVLISV